MGESASFPSSEKEHIVKTTESSLVQQPNIEPPQSYKLCLMIAPIPFLSPHLFPSHHYRRWFQCKTRAVLFLSVWFLFIHVDHCFGFGAVFDTFDPINPNLLNKLLLLVLERCTSQNDWGTTALCAKISVSFFF